MTFRRFILLILVASLFFSTNAFAGRAENKALFKAIQDDDVAAVKEAIADGANVRAMSFRGTPVRVAKKKGNQEIIDLLNAELPQEMQEEKKAEEPKEAPVVETVAPAIKPAEDIAPPVVAKPAPVKKKPAPAPKKIVPVSVTAQQPAGADVVAQAKEMVASATLKQAYNPIVVDYLIEEGKQRLPADVKKDALDQLVAALMAKTQVSKDEQLTMALGTLTGIAMGAAGNDIISGAGADVEGSYASEWSEWISSAFNLIHAGYSDDAAKFFEFGIIHIPYSSLQARCVKGLALARPDQAYDYLMEQADSKINEYIMVALPLLGLLATDESMSADKKAAILAKLTENTHGLVHSDVIRAAMIGLRNMNDPQAATVMKEFTTGLTVDKSVKRAALRGLLLTYGDQSVVETLSKMANSGSLFTMVDESEKVFAGFLLIEAQNPDGYAWAEKKLTPKRKSFFASKDEGPDPRADIVRYLVRYAGDDGKAILAKVITKYKDKDWMKTWIATGLLEMNDTTYIALVKSSLSNPEWDYTAVRIVEALANHGDYSGLAVLEQLIQKRPPKKSGAMKFMSAMAGKKDNTKQLERRLANLRIQIADALARINTDECVALLEMLLLDKNKYVRSSAAMALTEMTRPSALNGLQKAMDIDYGIVNDVSRNPTLQAHIVRLASIRFPADERTAQIQKSGTRSTYPSVRFLATIEP